MKFGVVNKSTPVNRFVLHTLHRNITHLAIITRETKIKLGILKKGDWKRAEKSPVIILYIPAYLDFVGLPPGPVIVAGSVVGSGRQLVISQIPHKPLSVQTVITLLDQHFSNGATSTVHLL